MAGGAQCRIFVDLKFFDIPATVAAAVRALRNRGVSFATVHGNQSIMEAAGAAKGDVKILAVTVLTSLDRGDLDDLGFECSIGDLVLSRARRALEAGCDGVIASALEVPRLRELHRPAVAGDHTGHAAGRQPAVRRSEARGLGDAGVRVGRRLHRRGPADP